MKKHLTKLTSQLLVLTMAFALAACGGANKDSAKEDEATPAYVYSTEFSTIAEGSENYLQPRVFTANGFYATSYEKVGEEIPEGVTPEYEGQYDVYAATLYFVDFSGTISKLADYESVTPSGENADKQNYNSSSDLNGLAVSSDGKLVAIENVYESWYDGPEGLTTDDDDYWNYQVYNNNYYIRTLDSNGKELSSAPIEVGDGEYLYAYNMVLDANDNIYVSMDTSVRVISLDGQTVATIGGDSGSEYINSLVRLTDGSVGATVYGNDGLELRTVDVDSKSFGETLNIPSDAYSLYSGGGDYDVYYTSGTNFYGYKFDTEENTKLFNWINCDINGDNVSNLLINDDGSVVCVLNEYDSTGENYDITLATLSLVPSSSVAQKTTLTLATQYLDYNVRDKIIDFNRKSTDCRIEIIDYSEYNTDEDYSAGQTKLTTELLAGNVPDIIDLNGMPYTRLASKGLLEDLYPYIDSDSELSREDFFPNILSALEVNGGLYTTCSSFYLQTVIGAASVVGDEPGWTYDEFNAALASMPEGCEPFDQYTTRDDILQTCLNLDMKDYVNWSTGEVNFDSQAFVDLLEFASLFPESFDWENYEYSAEDSTESRIKSGKQMLMQAGIYSLDDLYYNDMYFGGDSTYIGYPTSDGSVGSLISVNSGYAMSAKSENKDAVWQFLRTFLTEDGQKNIYSIPTNLNVYNDKLKEVMTPEYEKDADGNYKLDEDGNRIEISRGSYGLSDGTVYEIYAMTQQQADELYSVITSTTALADYSSNSIFDIVKEQSQAYFAGQKTAEEVAKLVQSKANIYVNEQR